MQPDSGKLLKLLPPDVTLAKMHQIVCRLGLRPKPIWGSLQSSPSLHS